MVGVTVPAGDPVRGGDDVDTGLKDPDVEVLVGKHTVKGEHIGFGGDDLFDGAGGADSDGTDTGDLTGIAADLVSGVAVQPDQLQIRMSADALDHLGADVAGGDLENANPAHVSALSG